MFEQDENWNRRRDFPKGPTRNRAGFTLVELLVVMTIIGILVALAMPAIMSAIENAHRIACANHVKQIGLATTQYETSLRQYPLNWGVVSVVGTPTNMTGPSVAGVSWLESLLPYIDEKPLASQLKLGQALGYVDSNGYNNLQVITTPISTYLCPSDSQRGTIGNQLLGTGAFATTNYKACAGSNWVVSFVNGAAGPAVTWPIGRNNGNSDGVDHGNGVICRGGGTSAGGGPIQTANMDIRDGASKTFLLGEAVPAFCGWSLWAWFDGSTATCGLPLNLSIPGTPPQNNSANWQFCYSFMSRHNSGGNFGMCDGSVAFINQQIDINVYYGLATIDGNETVTVTGLPVAVPTN